MKTRPTLPAGFAVAAHSVDVSGADGGAPKTRIQLLPMGSVTGRDGRGPYRLDDLAHAQSVVAASEAYAGSAKVGIDYDHQQVYSAVPGVGGTAIAAGWITRLDAQADGVWADVEWTPAAAEKLSAKEYRYISPYFGFDAATGRIQKIVNAGLTNFPNFTELAAVASADPQGNQMDLKAIAKALGLGEDATAEQIATAATALKAQSALAAAAATPDPAKYVPMAAFAELRDQVAKMQGDGLEARATAAVGAAIKDGKITPAGRDHAMALFKADEAAFAAFVGSAPKIVTDGALDAAGARPDADGPLTAAERHAARLVGVSEEKFLAAKKNGAR